MRAVRERGSMSVNKANVRHNVRRASGAMVIFVAMGLAASACGSRQSPTASPDTTAVLVEDTGPGTLELRNESARTVTRLWFSPSHVEGLWPGTTPSEFSALPSGASFSQSIPMGWWDVWVEADDGADALLYRTWFGNSQPTILTITESWWQLGDWIHEEIDESDETSAPQ